MGNRGCFMACVGEFRCLMENDGFYGAFTGVCWCFMRFDGEGLCLM